MTLIPNYILFENLRQVFSDASSMNPVYNGKNLFITKNHLRLIQKRVLHFASLAKGDSPCWKQNVKP